MFLILVWNVVDKVLPEAGEPPVAKTRWFKTSFVVFFSMAFLGFLGGLFSFLLFVQKSL